MSADDLHPLLRLDLERLQERGAKQEALRERRRRALDSSEAARREWDDAQSEADAADAKPASSAAWADALLAVAYHDRAEDDPPPGGAELARLRDRLLAHATPERADMFTGLLALDDDLLQLLADALASDA